MAGGQLEVCICSYATMQIVFLTISQRSVSPHLWENTSMCIFINFLMHFWLYTCLLCLCMVFIFTRCKTLDSYKTYIVVKTWCLLEECAIVAQIFGLS